MNCFLLVLCLLRLELGIVHAIFNLSLGNFFCKRLCKWLHIWSIVSNLETATAHLSRVNALTIVLLPVGD